MVPCGSSGRIYEGEVGISLFSLHLFTMALGDALSCLSHMWASRVSRSRQWLCVICLLCTFSFHWIKCCVCFPPLIYSGIAGLQDACMSVCVCVYVFAYHPFEPKYKINITVLTYWSVLTSFGCRHCHPKYTYIPIYIHHMEIKRHNTSIQVYK